MKILMYVTMTTSLKLKYFAWNKAEGKTVAFHAINKYMWMNMMNTKIFPFCLGIKMREWEWTGKLTKGEKIGKKISIFFLLSFQHPHKSLFSHPLSQFSIVHFLPSFMIINSVWNISNHHHDIFSHFYATASLFSSSHFSWQ